MGAMGFQITGVAVACSTVYSGTDKKESIKAVHHRPLWGESTGDRWIPLTKASNAESVSIWWRHHVVLAIDAFEFPISDICKNN